MKVIDKILNGSLKCFVEKGFNGSSISAITKVSKVSNGAIYHHFKLKEDIIYELYYRIKLELNEYVVERIEKETSTRNKVYAMWTSYIIWALENKEKSLFLNMFINSPYKNEVAEEKISELYKDFKEVLNKGIDEGSIEKMNFDMFFIVSNSSANGMIRYMNLHPQEDIKSFLEESFKFYWRSIVKL